MNSTHTHRPGILVAVDGSDQASLACGIAADLAGSWHAPLHIVHAWKPFLPATAYGGFAAGAVLTQDTVEVLREGAAEVMQKARAVVHQHGGMATEHLVEAADVPNAILDVAATLDASLIVAGRRGLGAVRRVLLGSVSEALLHHSTRPLLLLHGDATCWPPRTVVAAVDGSLEAERAARLGAQVAAAAGATAVLVHAVPRDADLLDNLDAATYQRTVADVTAGFHRRAEALHHHTGATVEARVELAAPVPAILAAAKTGPAPALIAMGTHGRGAAHRLVLGSVAERILHDEAVTSVLIVPPAIRRGR